ncbi:816c1383-6703-4d8b-a314-3a408d00a9a6-CDS [Sclerotinia trifoliorum]|uniref:816c1383-6703-4d8b-a314-3a408d00a9a6-CDS n=1 Tax=Sclerotinia trifoliorum TaxID=28548 RepID=A0A8H2W1I7_9HELO|nr:816c1383-6703-4d8b-a314-3a408d00a9a6-CDS [Sclerotinia trifoliorum]
MPGNIGFRGVISGMMGAVIPRYERKYGEESNKRTYHVAKEIPTLAKIDRPKKKGLRDTVKHRSEGGWFLPREHRRHFLNFPQEIIDMIFLCVLRVKDHTITPDVTTSNWVRAFKSHHTYSLDGEKSLISERSFSTIITQTRQDHQGKYFELRKVYRPRIDATLLRVCKSFNHNGTPMLYSENIFQFTTMDWSETGSPRSWFDPKEYDSNRRHTRSHTHFLAHGSLYEVPTVVRTGKWPSGGSEVDKVVVADVIRMIETPRIPILGNCGLPVSYHDHFYRFVHAIGKEKAAMLKTLYFSGRVILHNCLEEGNKCKLACNRDLIDTIRCYIPIINKYCTGLTRLVIEVEEDPLATDWSVLTLGLSGSLKSLFRRSISSLLEGQLRKLQTVKTLEVFQLFEIKDGIPADSTARNSKAKRHMRREKLDLAEPTIAWFKERVKVSENVERNGGSMDEI